MGDLRIPLFCAVQFLVFLQTKVTCYQYKVGDLASWAVPSSANKHVYTNWSKKTNLKIGDSLFFLYPPSEDSVIQVTQEAFKTCNLKDPILYMNNGNSLFNITSEGKYFFTSGEPGHCEKSQKLVVAVGNVLADDLSPSYGPSALPDSAPSYPTVFGSMPSTSASSSLRALSTMFAVFIGLAVFAGLN